MMTSSRAARTDRIAEAGERAEMVICSSTDADSSRAAAALSVPVIITNFAAGNVRRRSSNAPASRSVSPIAAVFNRPMRRIASGAGRGRLGCTANAARSGTPSHRSASFSAMLLRVAAIPELSHASAREINPELDGHA